MCRSSKKWNVEFGGNEEDGFRSDWIDRQKKKDVSGPY